MAACRMGLSELRAVPAEQAAGGCCCTCRSPSCQPAWRQTRQPRAWLGLTGYGQPIEPSARTSYGLDELLAGSLADLIAAAGFESPESAGLAGVAQLLQIRSDQLQPRTECVAGESWEEDESDCWAEQMELLQCMFPVEGSEGAWQPQPDTALVGLQLPWLAGASAYLALLVPAGFPDQPLLPLVHHPKLRSSACRALSIAMAAQSQEMAQAANPASGFDLVAWLQSDQAAAIAQPAAPKPVKPVAHNKQRTQPNKRAKRKRVVLSAEQRKVLDQQLVELQQLRERKMARSSIQIQRDSLPAAKHADEVIEALELHRVLLVQGHTGSGKTTQVAQFIMEHFDRAGRGGQLQMICTQPRRVAATSVAERVAAERGESCGQSVGYAIRGESKTCRDPSSQHFTRLLFCTTGVMLRHLAEDPELHGVSHVFIDEVHERSMESDFLLAALKVLLKHNSSLRVILMSATSDAALYARYFGGNVGSIQIAGTTHPVEDHWLPEALARTGFSVGYHGQICASNHGWEGEGDSEEEARYGEDMASSLGELDRLDMNRKVPLELVAAMVIEIDQSEGPGAVLVFLSGLDEIVRVAHLLRGQSQSDQLCLVELHGGMSGQEQRVAFGPTPHGQRKIILATNVAETSLTIADVTFVVDTGKHKQMQFDPFSKITSLVQVWISQANARQRRGRAGRTRPGKCFKLFTESEHEALASHQLPEMQRLPLEGMCLSVLVNGVAGCFDPHSFLASTMSPPKPAAVGAAIETLQLLGAVSDAAGSTPLGRLMDKIPASVHVARMVIFGVILGCVDAAAITASFMAQGTSPFSAPRAKRAEADAARAALRLACSDQITLVRTFERWHTARAEGKEEQFCRQHWVSKKVMRDVDKARSTFLRVLVENGLHDGNEHGMANANRTSVPVLQVR